MSTFCEIKPYINKLPISIGHKNYINDKHNEVVVALKNTKFFELKEGKLYAFKDQYDKSLAAITKINKKFGSKVAALINDEVGGTRLVQINAISLGMNYVEPTGERGIKFFRGDQNLFEQEGKENEYYQLPKDINDLEEPDNIQDLFTSIESIEKTIQFLNDKIFEDISVQQYYMTETNKSKFEQVLLNNGLNQKSVNIISNFIEKNNLHYKKLGEILGLLSQELILNSKGLKYYTSKLTQKADENLDKFLKNFLKEKLSVDVVDNLTHHYGSAMAVADILNKVIQINNKNLKTLPEETGHFFFELLGTQNKLQIDLLQNVEKWEGYNKVFEDYKNVYITLNKKGEIIPDINKIKREAVGQAIGEGIIRNYKAKQGDVFYSLLQEAIDFIKNFLKNLGLFDFNGIVDEIAKDILNEDISKIKQIKDDNYKKRTFKETLSNYPELIKIIEDFQEIGAVLTGSLGYRDQGDLFRPDDEDVHDLDFRVYMDAWKGDVGYFLAKLKEKYPSAKPRVKNNGELMTWSSPDGTISLLLEMNGLFIDLFFYPSYSKEEKVTNWYGAFEEKYKMGRPKDMNDILRWSNFKQENALDKSKPFVYYQLENEDINNIPEEESIKIKPGVEELFESNPELSKIGTKEQYSQYLESLNKPNTNPILQNNQEEQIKKFQELQERLSNKEFLEGAKGAFESSEELQQLGTQEKYNDYIARVSLGIIKNPSSGEYNYTSQVKDIVYHGTDKNFDKFIKELSGSKTGWAKDNKGIHFVDNKIAAETYTKSKEDAYGYLALWIYLKKDAKSGKSLTKEEFNDIISNNTKLANILEGAHYYGAIDIDNITFNQYDKWAKLFEKDKELDNYTRDNLDEILKSVTQKYLNKEANIKSVILNIKNPLIYDSKGKRYVHEIKNIYGKLTKENDGLLIENTLDRLNDDIGFEDNIQVVFEPEQIHILGSKQDIEGFKQFIEDKNNTKFDEEDYFTQEINNIREESKKIDKVLEEYNNSQKVTNKSTSKAINNKEEKIKGITDKLLSLGFETINKYEHDFKTSSYITFKAKLKEIENLDVNVTTFRSPQYLIKTKINSFKDNFDLQKQGELPFNPIELKTALKEDDFIQDIADNTFEGLTGEQIKILKNNLENGDFNLNCKI